MSGKKKPYDDPDNWEYDGGSSNWTGNPENLSPYMKEISDSLTKQAFPEGKEAYQKQQAPRMENNQNGGKPLTWLDIENNLRNSIRSSPGETDEEKLAYFKNKIISHLDKLQAEEDEKIIPFPSKKRKKPKE